MKPLVRLCILTTCLVTEAALAQAPANSDVRASVVRVMAVQQPPALAKPWLKQGSIPAMGTGVVIDGKRILTNAHLVSYAAHIQVQPSDQARRYMAKVAAIAPDVDLALLEVESPAIFDGRAPMSLGDDLPQIDDRVEFFGFPVGGNALRSTEAVVRRIEWAAYAYSTDGPRVELDGVVNNGNSGGPAIKDGKMIGIVYATSTEGLNIGYLIPAEEIRAFLVDVSDGRYEGKPVLWTDVQSLENPALRRKLNLPEDTLGVLVSGEHPLDPRFPLKPGDIITHIDNVKIDNDGMVFLKERNVRIAFQYLVNKNARQGKVPLTILRDGAERQIEAPVAARPEPLMSYLKSDEPSYFVWGPLALTAASAELVDGLAPLLVHVWAARSSPVLTRRGEFKKQSDEQLVVVVALFPHLISRGYANPGGQVVSHVNGSPIRNLQDLVKRLRKANEDDEPFVEFRFHDRYVDALVFDRREVMEAFDEILAANGIHRPASSDLTPFWQGR